MLLPPASAKTDEDKLAFYNRAWKLLHYAREEQRLAQWKSDPKGFKEWVDKTWQPMLDKLFALIAPLRKAVYDKTGGSDSAKNEAVISIKAASYGDDKWDADIHLGDL